MNTIRSVGYGWGVLILAGGGSYYFAKRQINADREARALAEEKRRQHVERLRAQETVSREVRMRQTDAKANATTKAVAGSEDHPSPSREVADDPAPVEHAKTGMPKSRFESAEPFRSRKGDRFS